MSDVKDADAVLELLGDEYVRTILAATSREPLSAKALADECDVALSTVYRRVEEMQDRDLLVERTELARDGSHHSVFEANVDHLDVDVTDGQIAVDLSVRESASERFTRIWQDIREA